MKYFLIPVCALAVSQALSAAQNSDGEFTVAVEAGLESDSQLTVEEIDQYEATSDIARHLQFEAEGDWQAGSNFNIKAGYNYMSKSYQDNPDFDLDIGRLYGDVSYDFTEVTLGTNHHSIDAKLAGDSFLDMSRTGFYAGRLFANSFYVRAELLDIKKTFNTLSDRDANADVIALDAYYFFNQGLSFIAFGLESEEETAQVNYYSYDADNYRATYSNEFNWLSKRNQLKLNWRYYQRDYQDIYPDIEESREDTRNSFSLTWDLFFNDSLSLITHLEQTYSESNLPSADYDATQISLILRAEF